jgi:hypothetical protein
MYHDGERMEEICVHAIVSMRQGPKGRCRIPKPNILGRFTQIATGHQKHSLEPKRSVDGWTATCECGGFSGVSIHVSCAY